MRASTTATIVVDPKTGAIDVNDQACGKATVANTLRIIVVPSAEGRQVIRIDLSGGKFANPRTGARIRFTGDLGSRWDRLSVLGTKRADDITIGSHGIVNLDVASGPNADVNFDNLERVIVAVGAGNDFVSANGHDGTGAPAVLRGRITEFGGSGEDALTGSSHCAEPFPNCIGLENMGDTIHGQGGDDTIKGLAGNDNLFGDAGIDHLRGGPPAGSPDPDKCWIYPIGATHTSSNGGTHKSCHLMD
jgi:Ca2+-binding RTX toxin-like protein